ncbi:MAG: hypothetical protein ACJ75J_02325 [Cytophagaceae bacterium]
MKKNLLAIACLLFSLSVIAQEKKETLTLDRNDLILNVMYFPQNGLILKKGKDYMNSKALDWEMFFYNPDLTLKYKASIEKTQINKGFRNYFVTSPDAKYIYHIEGKGYNTTFGASSQFITQFDETGAKKTYELENLKDLGNREVMFADSQYMYYIATVNVKDEVTKKKKQKTILIKLKSTDFSRQDVEVKLPGLKDEDYSSDWFYCGNGENKIYFMSKTVKDDGTFIYDLITMDRDGKILSNISMDAKLSGVFPRPTYNEKYYFWADFENPDFYTSTYTSSYSNAVGSYTSTDVSVNHTLSAFGDIVIDEKSNSIYIYGLTGPAPYKRLGPLNKGYFVQKYDLAGKEIWKKQYDFGQEILDNEYVRLHSTPYGRSLKFKINPDNTVKLQLLAKDMVYTFMFDGTGKQTSTYSNEFKNRSDASFSMAYNPAVGSEAVKYLISKDPKLTKAFKYNMYNFDKNDVVLENDTKTKTVNLLLFKK